MKQKTFIPNNENKYKNARISLLVIIFFSVINLLMVFFLDRYFLFSAYFSQVLTIVGYSYYLETSEMLYLIVSSVLVLLSVLPYFLCWIFSKKKPGWMIAALVLFSLDSLMYLYDLVGIIQTGNFEVNLIVEIAIRFFMVYYLVEGVRFGFAPPKNPSIQNTTTTEDTENSDDTENAVTETRKITIVRKKSFVASAVKLTCFVNGKEVCRIKNGESLTIDAPCNGFELGVSLPGQNGSGMIFVESGNEAVSYQIGVKMGMTTANISITPIT